MKISKEVRIGILATLSILILFIGYDFLKTATFFSNERFYHCFYDDVEGLQVSAAVQIRGLNVGHVASMELVDAKGVKVTLSIYKNADIPVGTMASLETEDLLGTKAIRLDPGKGPGLLKSGSELISNKEGGVVDNVANELTPRLKELKAIFSAFDSTLAGVNAIIGLQNQKTIAEAIQSIDNSAKNIQVLTAALDKETSDISGVMHNLSSFTGNLASQNDSINHLIANANNITKQLANAPIQKMITDLQHTTRELSETMEKVNKGEGSLGLLINDKDLYNNLKNSLGTLNKLLADLNAHPSRYVNISLIGGKKKD